jgi:hypothetical protein
MMRVNIAFLASTLALNVHTAKVINPQLSSTRMMKAGGSAAISFSPSEVSDTTAHSLPMSKSTTRIISTTPTIPMPPP